MNEKEFEFLLKQGEGLKIEFKEKYSSRIDEDIVAFANSKGGVLILGVSDKGKIVGQSLTNEIKAQINTLARNCSPSIEVKISSINQLVIIEICEGKEKPYSCSSGYYRRLDGNTQKMNHEEIRIMFSDNELVAFEDKINRTCTIQNVSEEKMKRFLKEANIINSHQQISEILSSINVLSDGFLKNSGILMFVNEVCNFIPQSKLSLLRFKGDTKADILDRIEVQDYLLTQFEQSIFFLKKHLNLKSTIKGTERKEEYDVPVEVWREVIANAIIHRDYSITGANISVEIYDSYILISSPGSLPKSLSEKEFGKVSVRRNELLADLFSRMYKVEKAGTGIQRMKDIMNSVGLPEPKFCMSTFFIVELSRTTQKTPQKTVLKSTESEQKLLNLIKENSFISRKEIARKLGISEDTVKEYLEKLKRKGLLLRIGPDKGGYWEVTKPE